MFWTGISCRLRSFAEDSSSAWKSKLLAFARWLAEPVACAGATAPRALAIGLAWDCQLEETIPIEPHDQPLDLVVTQTRVYGPWS